MLFTTPFCAYEAIFLANGEILQNKYFQYFERSKKRHDRAKIGLAGQQDWPPLKNYFEPWNYSKYLQLILNQKA